MKHPKVGWRYSNQKMTNQRDINTKTTKIKHREIVIYTTETDLIIEAINSIVKKNQSTHTKPDIYGVMVGAGLRYSKILKASLNFS